MKFGVINLILANQALFGGAQSVVSTKAPTGCLKISKDADFPSEAVWEAALPGVRQIKNGDEVGPDYRLRVKDAAEVEKAIKFAKDNSIRLSIIATGHDTMARSNAASGLLLDVSLLQGIRISETFTPTTKGAASALGAKAKAITPKAGVQAAVTFGSGTTAQQLYDGLSSSKLFPMTAGHGEVSVAGGWGQFGGHGPLTHLYGLGVDQWLEAKIVTPGGLKVANQVSNPDLFWAIRGGGGGNFGVVVEATIKVYPDVPITGFNWWINSTTAKTPAGAEQFAAATSYLLGQLPELHAKGIGGPIYSIGAALRGYTIHAGNLSGTANANAAWKPTLEKLQSFQGMTKYQTRPYNFKNFKEFYDTTYGRMDSDEMMERSVNLQKRHGPSATTAPTNYGLAPMDTHLLGATHLRSPKLIDALKKQGNNWIMIMAAPKPGVGDIAGTSVNPSWRKAVVHYVGMSGGSNVRTVAPEMGAYGNEAEYNEPDWQNAFWGANYKRLVDIKTKYDPTSVFWVSPGVKADFMKVDGERLCRVNNPPAPRPDQAAPKTDNPKPAEVAVLIERFGKTELIGGFPVPGQYVGLQS